jgi:MOSC domain-containing protein YiiM
VDHLTTEQLEAALPAMRQAPADGGTVELIVRRPAVDRRQLLDEGVLDVADGLVGDTWRDRPSSRMPDQQPHPDMQITVVNYRALAAICPDPDRRPLAGDQFYVDLDLSIDNLPPGTRLSMGEAVIEVTEQPHTGCAKYAKRFGPDALRFVNSPVGKELRLRGLNAKVVLPGRVRRGDVVKKLDKLA